MKTFILFWNPTISDWKLDDCQECIENEILYDFNWAVWEHKEAHKGDRFFMVRCGDGHTGICMSGHFRSEPYIGDDWSGKGREVHYCFLDVEVYIHPELCPILPTATLQEEIPGFDWTGGHSGRVLDAESADKLERLWSAFLEQHDGMFHKYAYKQTEYDEDDDYDDDDDEREFWVDVKDTGEIVIEDDFEYEIEVRGWTLDETKEKLYNVLSALGADVSNVHLRYSDVMQKMEPLYEKALSIASSKHHGQMDKGGQPYLGHLVRVSNACTSDKAKIVALLHDSIEDTDVTPEYLRTEGFPEDVVKSILAVTRKTDEEYEDFMQRVAKNRLGREVKIRDLEDNMDVRRLEELTDSNIERLKKYFKAWRYLKGK